MRIGSLVFGKTDMMLRSPKEFPKVVFRRGAEEMAFNERLYARILIRTIYTRHNGFGLHGPAGKSRALHRSRVDHASAMQCNIVPATRTASNDQP